MERKSLEGKIEKELKEIKQLINQILIVIKRDQIVINDVKRKIDLIERKLKNLG